MHLIFQKINSNLTILTKTEEIRAETQYLEYEKNAKSQRTQRQITHKQPKFQILWGMRKNAASRGFYSLCGVPVWMMD
jgi:hypothetical protein